MIEQLEEEEEEEEEEEVLVEESATYKFLPSSMILPAEPLAYPMGSVASRAANQIMTSNAGPITFMDWLMSGSRKKSRVTSAFAPMASKPLISKVFESPVPVGYMVQLALTSSAVMLESITGRIFDLDLTLA